MKKLLLTAAWLLQGCVFNSNESGICGSGRYDFTRYYYYNERDSLVSRIALYTARDTSKVEHFEYDTTGHLRKYHGTFWDLEDNRTYFCENYERGQDGRTVISTYCFNPNNYRTVTTLDDQGRAILISDFLDSGSTPHQEERMKYDERGNLIEVESESGGVKYVSSRTFYDSLGIWTESKTYNPDGTVTFRKTNEILGPYGTKERFYNSLGELIGMEIHSLDSKKRFKKSTACKAPL